jgi:hypothetical protein
MLLLALLSALLSYGSCSHKISGANKQFLPLAAQLESFDYKEGDTDFGSAHLSIPLERKIRDAGEYYNSLSKKRSEMFMMNAQSKHSTIPFVMIYNVVLED